MTRGARELAAHLAKQNTTQEAFAEQVSERLGVQIHQTTIGRTLAGTTIPRGQLISALSALAGISAEAWSEPSEEAPVAESAQGAA